MRRPGPRWEGDRPSYDVLGGLFVLHQNVGYRPLNVRGRRGGRPPRRAPARRESAVVEGAAI